MARFFGIFLFFSFFATSTWASNEIRIQVTHPQTGEALEYIIESHDTISDAERSLARNAESEKEGLVILNPENKENLKPFASAINHLSRLKKVALIEGLPQKAKNLYEDKSEKLAKMMTITLVGATSYISWYFFAEASITTTALMTAWTVVTNTYFNYFINNYHRMIDKSVAKLGRLFRTSGEKWEHRHRHLSLFLMSIGINTVSLSLFEWQSIQTILLESSFYIALIKNSTLGYLASDLWTVIFNTWRTNGKVSWKTVRYLSYSRTILLTFTWPFLMLDYWYGYAAVGAMIASGTLFNTSWGDKIIQSEIPAKFMTAMKSFKEKVVRKKSLSAIRCQAALSTL